MNVQKNIFWKLHNLIKNTFSWYYSKKEVREMVKNINKNFWTKAKVQTIRKGIDF